MLNGYCDERAVWNTGIHREGDTGMVKRYLELRSLDEALTLLTTSFTNPRRTERVPLMQSVGRVVAEPVFAK